MSADDRIVETRAALEALLRRAGCVHYSADEARADAQECSREIRADTLAHGAAADRPFFSFVVTENVGIFTFYEPSLSIFVVPGDEMSLRSHFDALAMVDVEPARELLASQFGKSAPDLTLDEVSTRAWLRGD